MKKISTAAKKSAPKFINDTDVQLTREFAKTAMIFGTAEYKLWREIKKDCPDAVMVLKTIKKTPSKRTSTKNMTYEHMAIYIRQQEDAEKLMTEFKKQIAISKVQTTPYRSVLAWFIQKFEGYDNYKSFFATEAEKTAQAEDIFAMYDEELDLAS